jgi:nucleoside-diphosphate-sugar epimerase
MNIFINNALDNKDLIIFGDPESKTLDFTYVEDFVDGVMLAINGEWNKEYNISGNEEVRVIDLARFIIREAGSESDIVVRDREVAQPQRVKVDISEIEKLGYKPKVNLWRGVRRNVEFLRGVR